MKQVTVESPTVVLTGALQNAGASEGGAAWSGAGIPGAGEDADHHIEHIYNQIGASTRAAAAFGAM